jgi:hypothetical protein
LTPDFLLLLPFSAAAAAAAAAAATPTAGSVFLVVVDATPLPRSAGCLLLSSLLLLRPFRRSENIILPCQVFLSVRHGHVDDNTFIISEDYCEPRHLIL